VSEFTLQSALFDTQVYYFYVETSHIVNFTRPRVLVQAVWLCSQFSMVYVFNPLTPNDL
jgi:hypothetical protein